MSEQASQLLIHRLDNGFMVETYNPANRGVEEKRLVARTIQELVELIREHYKATP